MTTHRASRRQTGGDAPFGPPNTLHEALEEIARGMPKDKALVVDSRELTFRELWQEVNLATRLLATTKAPAGSLIGIGLADPRLAVIWILGIMKSGRIPVLLADLDEHKLGGVLALQRVGVQYYLTSDDLQGRLAHCETTHLTADLVLSTDLEVPNRRVALRASDPALILFTSGTTGDPRPVLHHHRGLLFAASRLQELQGEFFSGPPLSVARRICQVLGRNPLAAIRSFRRQVWMTDLVPSSIGGLTILIQSLMSGHTLVMSAGHLPRKIMRTIEDYQVTMFATVPAVARALASSNAATEFDLSSLMIIGIGGGFVSPQLVKALREKFRCEIVIGYGSTELGGGVLATRPYDSLLTRTTTVGRPFPGVSVSIRDSNGAECVDGQSGDLWCETPGRMGSYLDGPDPGESPERVGWFRTSDLAVRDADGAIRVIGRSDDMIIRGGRKIAPYEIETCLMELESLTDVAVAGVRESTGEDSIHAWVVLKAGSSPSATELRSQLSVDAPLWCIPQHWHFVEDIPRTPSGEVSRRLLVQRDLDRESSSDV